VFIFKGEILKNGKSRFNSGNLFHTFCLFLRNTIVQGFTQSEFDFSTLKKMKK